jgi:Icc-related predicted phosphoesterase
MSATNGKVRLAAVGDIHCGQVPSATLQSLFADAAERADVLLLCGDLTDYGLPEEARQLLRDLAAVRIPILAVLGNHDFESGRADEVKAILAGGGIKVLDGDGVEIHGIGFAGVKGFGGGFGRRTLEPWGEETVKAFVREAVDEALKLESALARLQSPTRVAVLHYAPIEATVEGEPREIFPFLGSSRLEEPLNRYGVAMAFHGHAHRGTLEGRTSGGVPVYNVALPLLRKCVSDERPLFVVELAVPAPLEEVQAVPARRREDR